MSNLFKFGRNFSAQSSDDESHHLTLHFCLRKKYLENIVQYLGLQGFFKIIHENNLSFLESTIEFKLTRFPKNPEVFKTSKFFPTF